MDNRFYLQALGITGLFVALMVLIWVASGGPANEEAVQRANNTRTSIAMTGDYLLRPRTSTPGPAFPTETLSSQTSAPQATSTLASLPSATSTSLLAQLNTPFSSPALTITSLPTQTAAPQVPIFTSTISVAGQVGTKPPAASTQFATPAQTQDPADFARWYFTRVWNERDYQNLWDNYLTLGFKTNVGSGLFEDYVTWWGSVARVDIHTVDVLENNGQRARVRVNLTFHMNDGRVVENQVYEYDFLFDSLRSTWMFDAGS